jgi:glycosyltransferase involved in cell wall biosynthesis
MGGLGVHLANVLKNIDTENFSVSAITIGDTEKILENGVKIFSIEGTPSLMFTKDALSDTFILQSKYVAKALSLITAGTIQTPDIIHILDWSCAIAGEEIAAVTGAKIVFAVHLSINNYINNVHPLQQLLLDRACSEEFEACKRACKIIHVTQNYADLFPFSAFAHKTEIIHNGVNYSEFANAGTYELPGEKAVKVVYIGRITEMKNVQALWSINLPVNVDLIFIGGEQGSSSQLIADLQNFAQTDDQIHYIAGLYGQDKINAMSSADLIVMPSVHEPFGLVALEALAASQNGKTILAASFVDGLGEFLTAAAAINCGTSVTSIQNAVEAFLNLTETKKTEMRTAAMALAQAYSWGQTTSKIQNVWNNL